jgi:hypothetical protein
VTGLPSVCEEFDNLMMVTMAAAAVVQLDAAGAATACL